MPNNFMVSLAIHNGSFTELESLHSQAVQLYLKAWDTSPSVGASHIKDEQLEQFQRLLEVRESSQILADSSSHSVRRTLPDLKLLLKSWRHRLPYNEPISVWNDVFNWRLKFFTNTTEAFAWTNPGNLAALHDR